MCRQIIIIKFQHTIFSPKSNKKIANEIFTQANENAIAITTQRKGNTKTFCNFSARRQKTICIIAERRRKKRCFSTLLSFIVFRCHHCRCVDDSRRLFLTMFQMGKTKSNAKMENYWNLECNWVSNGFASRNIKWQRGERSLTKRERVKEGEGSSCQANWSVLKCFVVVLPFPTQMKSSGAEACSSSRKYKGFFCSCQNN